MNTIVIEVERRRDGRRYPPGGSLPEPLRWRAASLAHQLHCRDGLTIRATQQALAARGLRHSVGMIHRDLTRYACDACDGPPQQPGPPAADRSWAGAGWAGPAPA
jgi:hypothetical protein